MDRGHGQIRLWRRDLGCTDLRSILAENVRFGRNPLFPRYFGSMDPENSPGKTEKVNITQALDPVVGCRGGGTLIPGTLDGGFWHIRVADFFRPRS